MKDVLTKEDGEKFLKDPSGFLGLSTQEMKASQEGMDEFFITLADTRSETIKKSVGNSANPGSNAEQLPGTNVSFVHITTSLNIPYESCHGVKRQLEEVIFDEVGCIKMSNLIKEVSPNPKGRQAGESNPSPAKKSKLQCRCSRSQKIKQSCCSRNRAKIHEVSEAEKVILLG